MRRLLAVTVLLAGCAGAGRMSTMGTAQSWFARDGITREQFEADVREAKLIAIEGDDYLPSHGGKTSRVVNELRRMGYRLVPADQAQPWAAYPRR